MPGRRVTALDVENSSRWRIDSHGTCSRVATI
jgi:hypothetical protein